MIRTLTIICGLSLLSGCAVASAAGTAVSTTASAVGTVVETTVDAAGSAVDAVVD